jgi:hypothetical protein
LQKRNIPTDGDKEIEVILNGSKIMGLTYRNITLKDSSLFIPIPISEFPKAFNLPTMCKEFFPYKFIKPKNYNYVGKWPNKEEYDSDFFSSKKKAEFLVWYDEQKNKIFDFQFQLEQYCLSDLTILTEGCLAYSRANRLSSATEAKPEGYCPFQHQLTLASFCNFIYRANFMPENSIGMLPACGYNPKSNSSRKCELWLKYLSETHNYRIQHAKNGGEKSIGKYFVDGFCEEKKLIFEFNGDYIFITAL